MLKLEAVWVRPVMSEEGRPLYTETAQWWRDNDDATWIHTGYTSVGQYVARSHSAGFALAYLEVQREFHAATGWTQTVLGGESFPDPVTLARISELRAAYIAKQVKEEPAA